MHQWNRRDHHSQQHNHKYLTEPFKLFLVLTSYFLLHNFNISFDQIIDGGMEYFAQKYETVYIRVAFIILPVGDGLP